MMRRISHLGLAIAAVLLFTSELGAQNPPAGPGQPAAGGRGGGGFRSAYPQRAAADPAALERGKGIYSVNCAFCHGSDARGGEGGPNLLRSTAVLNDSKGELIAPIVKNGRPAAGMPPLNLNETQIADVAAYLHSFPVGGRDVNRSGPPNPVVGNAAAGKALFASKCASCHSETGDMNGIATRISDPKALQQTWLMPGGGRGGRGAPAVKTPPVTVTVTLDNGAKVEGRLERIDDFLVTLRDSEGRIRSFPLNGERPKVTIHDPLQPHLDALQHYTDQNIHDITAYLVTLK
jgi:cytochrome c oxidase cbb3-type subunit III